MDISSDPEKNFRAVINYIDKQIDVLIKYIHKDPTIALVLVKPRTCYNSL